MSAAEARDIQRASTLALRDDLIAIDLVVLPTPEIDAKLVAVNKVLVEDAKGFALDATHRAHMTIVQAYVRRCDIGSICSAVTAVVEELFAFTEPEEQIQCSGMERGPEFTPGKLMPFVAAPSVGPARKFHDVVSKRLEPFRQCPVTPEGHAVPQAEVDAVQPCFFKLPGEEAAKINMGSVAWVANFLKNASYDKFEPHFTLGAGTPPVVDKLCADASLGISRPFSFPLRHIALFQLGDFCTCRRVILSIDLLPPVPASTSASSAAAASGN